MRKKGGTRFYLTSFEPLNPIGFGACGVAFGAVRKPYTAPAKFFADDVTADNRIIWYPVSDDTPLYDGWTVFWPRVDTPSNEATSAYEVEGVPSLRLKAPPVTNVWGFSGDHVHGDDEDFRGLAPRSKYFDGDTLLHPIHCPVLGGSVECHGECIDMGSGGILANCYFCGHDLIPDVLPVMLSCPDFPELDGLTFSIGRLVTGDGICIWKIDGDDAPIDGFSASLNLSAVNFPHAYWDIQIVHLDGHVYQTVLEFSDDWLCDPFMLADTAELILDDGHPTGIMVTILIGYDHEAIDAGGVECFAECIDASELLGGGVECHGDCEDFDEPPETFDIGVECHGECIDGFEVFELLDSGVECHGDYEDD